MKIEIMANIPKKNPQNEENSDNDFYLFGEKSLQNRTNFVWFDGVKALIMRNETLNTTCTTMLYLGLIVNFIKKV